MTYPTQHPTVDLVPATPGWEVLYLPTPRAEDLIRTPVIGWIATLNHTTGSRTFRAATVSRLVPGLVESVEDPIHGREVWEVVPAGSEIDPARLEWALTDRVATVRGLVMEALENHGGQVALDETEWTCHGIEFGKQVIDLMIEEGVLTREFVRDADPGPYILTATASQGV